MDKYTDILKVYGIPYEKPYFWSFYYARYGAWNYCGSSYIGLRPTLPYIRPTAFPDLEMPMPRITSRRNKLATESRSKIPAIQAHILRLIWPAKGGQWTRLFQIYKQIVSLIGQREPMNPVLAHMGNKSPGSHWMGRSWSYYPILKPALQHLLKKLRNYMWILTCNCFSAEN